MEKTMPKRKRGRPRKYPREGINGERRENPDAGNVDEEKAESLS